MYGSVLRARSSNQRSHRSPRHAVARALTHPSLTGVCPGPEDSHSSEVAGAAGPARCRAKPSESGQAATLLNEPPVIGLMDRFVCL
jgi:hypothetical protein